MHVAALAGGCFARLQQRGGVQRRRRAPLASSCNMYNLHAPSIALKMHVIGLFHVACLVTRQTAARLQSGFLVTRRASPPPTSPTRPGCDGMVQVRGAGACANARVARAVNAKLTPFAQRAVTDGLRHGVGRRRRDKFQRATVSLRAAGLGVNTRFDRRRDQVETMRGAAVPGASGTAVTAVKRKGCHDRRRSGIMAKRRIGIR